MRETLARKRKRERDSRVRWVNVYVYKGEVVYGMPWARRENALIMHMGEERPIYRIKVTLKP